MLRIRRQEPAAEEFRLGEAIERLFRDGITNPEKICSELTAGGLRAPDGSEWTAASLAAYLANLA